MPTDWKRKIHWMKKRTELGVLQSKAQSVLDGIAGQGEGILGGKAVRFAEEQEIGAEKTKRATD